MVYSSDPMRLRALGRPSHSRAAPSPWQADYVQLRCLRVQLGLRVNRFWSPGAQLDLLDVGCDRRPYEPMLQPFVGRYIGLDVAAGPGVDLVGTADAIPLADGSVDCVLCTQVLQYVPDPAAAIREIRRVLRPAGAVFLSTHGTSFVDRQGADRWRWTQHGLAELFDRAGPWTDFEILPAGGVACAAAYLAGGQVAFAAHHVGLPIVAAPICLALNALAWNVDRMVRNAFPERSPDATVNYFVAARRPAV